MEKLNVAIADDNERMVQLLDNVVSSDEELQVVGKAGRRRTTLRDYKGKRTGYCVIRHYYAKGRWTDGYGSRQQRFFTEKTACIYCDFSSGTGKNYRRCFCTWGRLLYLETV